MNRKTRFILAVVALLAILGYKHLYPKMPDDPHSHWLFYFRVADADAAHGPAHPHDAPEGSDVDPRHVRRDC